MEVMVTDDDVKRNISANLERILADRGWTRKRLADAAGESEMNISRVYRGLCVCQAGLLARIAEALDVSTDRLIGTPPEKAPQKVRQSA